MFEDQSGPHLFATRVGRDLCADLVEGLEGRLDPAHPDALARVQILVANGRMQRRLKALFVAKGHGFLPRIGVVQSFGDAVDLASVPPALPPLHVRLKLADMVRDLIDRVPNLAPRAALYDLADSWAHLMGEMFEEGVTPEDFANLDLGDHAIHWQRAQQLLGLITEYFQDLAPLTQEARQSLVIDRMIARWQVAPPAHPILLAGSTGSRGATLRLMQAVAGLPNGAVVLPGLDRHLPRQIWTRLLEGRQGGLSGEDHPQYRLAKVAAAVGIDPWDIPDWQPGPGGNEARTKAVSLALRPAPVTDQWRREGPRLEGLEDGFADVSLIEAPSPQLEATTIALRLREAVENGQRAALISGDTRLVRQVTAALDRWGILPDDSAGQSLALTPGGRFLRHVAELLIGPPPADAAVALLKHPTCHSGADRGPHLKRSRDLELDLIRGASRLPHQGELEEWVENYASDEGLAPWVDWVRETVFERTDASGELTFAVWVERHLALAEQVATGPDGSAWGRMFDGSDAGDLSKFIEEVRSASDAGGLLTAAEYRDLFTAVLQDREARQAVRPHADILIWGTQEARVQGADLMILSGLNEGNWPRAMSADPWLNRAMRGEIGLRLPDRVVGLAAHDFQQAIAAPEVWLTRSMRDDETDTVASRWLSRLTNLLRGSGPEAEAALEGMRARGADYLALAERLTRPEGKVDREPRPSPRPPVVARPKRLSVTQIETLVRDPYEIYARTVLGLRALDPLRAAPDAALRGSALHTVLEAFTEEFPSDLPEDAAATFLQRADDILRDQAPSQTSWRLWRARLERSAAWFIETERERRQDGAPWLIEAKAEWDVPGLGVTLSGKADRIDRLKDGRLAIYDYKSGKPPTPDQERAFNKQLWLEALMAEVGGFAEAGRSDIGRIAYIGLGASPSEVAHDPDAEELARVRQEFLKLIGHYLDPGNGFPSRRAVQNTRWSRDYDQLARFGEWDETQTPEVIPVGGRT